jgi:solute carrier family 10 (sodium/bile acid cotransporter), member 7
VPLAAAIFPAPQVGMLLLPVMIFHQAQLMVCSVMAKRYAALSPSGAPTTASL